MMKCFMLSLTSAAEERLMCLVVGELVVINLYDASGRQGRRERQVFYGETVERLVRLF